MITSRNKYKTCTTRNNKEHFGQKKTFNSVGAQRSTSRTFNNGFIFNSDVSVTPNGFVRNDPRA